MIKVSICIPAYEQPKGLRRALESIRIQTWTDYEVVICDDSADDRVQRVADEFANILPIRYQRNSPSKGSPENWNEAMRQAAGEYITILHHDDWFSHERTLAEFVKLLDDNPAVDMAFCSSVFHFADGSDPTIHRCTESQLASIGRDPRTLFRGNLIGPPSAVVFRSRPGLFFDRTMVWLVDIEFYIRMLPKNGEIAYCDEPLVSITNGQPNQLTAQCRKDSALQVRESTYLYQKMTRDRAFSWPLFSYLAVQFWWHGMRSTRDLIKCGVPEPIPLSLRAAVMYSWVLRIYGRATRGVRWIVGIASLGRRSSA